MEIHQKKAGLDYDRLKTIVKRSIEQNLRMKNFEARNGNYETSAVVKNQGTKQREQRILGDCWEWETNGQCSKGDNCSFRHDINKRAKSTHPNLSPRSLRSRVWKKHREPEVPEAKVQVGKWLQPFRSILNPIRCPSCFISCAQLFVVTFVLLELMLYSVHEISLWLLFLLPFRREPYSGPTFFLFDHELPQELQLLCCRSRWSLHWGTMILAHTA